MESSSAVFIKTLKVDLCHRDSQTLIYTKNKEKKKSQRKKPNYMQFFLSGFAFQRSSPIFQKNHFSKKQKFKYRYVRL